MSITMTVFNLEGCQPTGERNHLLFSFARPGRVEIATGPDGSLIAHVYEGAAIDLDQSPILALLSTDTDFVVGDAITV